MSLAPFDDRDGLIWYDGRLVPWRDAKLHVVTHLQLPTIFAFQLIGSLDSSGAQRTRT
jgi:hypothetical protein